MSVHFLIKTIFPWLMIEITISPSSNNNFKKCWKRLSKFVNVNAQRDVI